MQSPPDQLRDMIEAIFAKTDEFRARHELDPPGDQTGFNELLRLVFSDNPTAGAAIFASLMKSCYQIYGACIKKRVLGRNEINDWRNAYLSAASRIIAGGFINGQQVWHHFICARVFIADITAL